MSSLIVRIEKHLTNNGPIILIRSGDDFLASSEWGQEAEDSPMAGAAAYGLADSVEGALTQVLDQAGVK